MDHDTATNPATQADSLSARILALLATLWARTRLWLSDLDAIRPRPVGVEEARVIAKGSDIRFLIRPALLGFAALTSVAVGSSFPSSPFKLEMAGTWFFGLPLAGAGPDSSHLLFGLVAVYGGLLLLMRVWIQLAHALAVRPGVSIKHLAWILVLWTVPMLVVAPLFSRDIFSYAAQGEMMSRHLNPYHFGPFSLGSVKYVNPVDPLWGNTPAPYGPLFLLVDGFFARVTFHNQMASLVLLRVLAVAGVALIAYALPKLAKVHGRDPGLVFVLGVLNPLVVLTLVAGAHNDAIMVGLLVAGLTAGKLRRPMLGVVLCALAAAIKAPAGLGVLYVAWEWLGTGIPLRHRIRPLIKAAGVTLLVFAVLSALSGLGWGWIGNLATPGTVRSWVAPATGIGMALSGLLHSLGIGLSMTSVLSVTRLIGLLGAVITGFWCLRHSDEIGSTRAIGITLLAFVILGPVVQPWYLTWGVVILTAVATGRLLYFIVGISVISPFIGLPGASSLLNEIIHADPLAIALSLMVLLGVFLAPLGEWSRLNRNELLSASPI
ncbi:MAG: polyprenol phosphomannose-dependent alpha 1,6 mannosyltransferase MptB [Actinomycetes bacterium]